MQSQITFPLFGYTMVLSSGTLLALGASLLLLAGVLLIFARKHRVTLQHSLVTDELMVHLSRIADALERQAARPVDQIIVEALKQSERSAKPKEVATAGSRTVPYSMFGREVSPTR
jgi:hypothetical protein